MERLQQPICGADVNRKTKLLLEAFDDVGPMSVLQLHGMFVTYKEKSLKTQVSRLKVSGHLEYKNTVQTGCKGRPTVIYDLTDKGRSAIYESAMHPSNTDSMIKTTVRKTANSVFQFGELG